MSQLSRRNLLIKGSYSIIGLPALIAGQTIQINSGLALESPSVPDEKERWMSSWMDYSTKNVEGSMFLSRFVEPIYYLLKPISWIPNKQQEHEYKRVDVPSGFVTDLASVPKVFFSVLRPDGEYTYPAIVHDYLYWTQTTSRETADRIFKLGMQDFGVSTSDIAIIYGAVRMAGALAWNNNLYLKKRGEKRFLKKFPNDPRIRWSQWREKADVFQEEY